MFSIAVQPAFEALSMDFEDIGKVFMPILIKHHDKSSHTEQTTDFEEIIMVQPRVVQRGFIRVEN